MGAEPKKRERDRALAPWQIALGGVAAGAALFAAGGAPTRRLPETPTVYGLRRLS